MRKKVILVSIGIIILLLIAIISIIIINNNRIETKAIELINTHIKDIGSFVNKYDIKTNGIVEVKANYKGAHGESYPADFIYNYELSDKLYFEDKKYTYLDINNQVLNIIKNLRNVNKLDASKYDKRSSKGNVITYTYNANTINEVLNSNYNSVKLKIFTKGLYKVIDHIEVDLDTCKIVVDKKEISITYNNNDIDIIKNDAGYYLDVNGKLKCNIFVNDDNYTFSIVLNNAVYYLEIREDELIIKFNSSAAIYNSIDMHVKYEENKLSKNKLDDNFLDNPILRYLSKSDLSLWR